MNQKLLLKATNLQKSYGIKKLFNIKSLEVFENERIGLIGINGCGKSTLLKILANQEPVDSGEIKYYSDFTIMNQPDNQHVAIDYSINDYQYYGIFSVFQNQGYSGGENTKKLLAKTFALQKPLLLIDEPTTSLDIESIDQLKIALQNYQGSFVMVSHDKALINQVCNRLWIIDQETVRVFNGSYDDWLKQQSMEFEFKQEEYQSYKKEQQRLTKVARNIREEGNRLLKKPKNMSSSEAILYKNTAKVQQAHVQKRAKAILKRTQQISKKERPKALPKIDNIRFGNLFPIKSHLALTVDNLTIGYESEIIIKQASFVLPSQTKTALIGANGSGKTSIIKAIMNQHPAIKLSPQAVIGYYDQNINQLDEKMIVLDYIMTATTKTKGDIQTVLANLLFTQQDVSKPISVLSGGEKAKVELTRLLVSDCNFLILDEPTNNLDLITKEAVMRLLQQWEGTLLLVTHEQALIEAVAQRVLSIENKETILMKKVISN